MEPEATAREKNSAAGGFDMGSFEAFGFSPVIVETLRVAANHSVAANTWASYATAERHIAMGRKGDRGEYYIPLLFEVSPGLCGLPTCT